MTPRLSNIPGTVRALLESVEFRALFYRSELAHLVKNLNGVGFSLFPFVFVFCSPFTSHPRTPQNSAYIIFRLARLRSQIASDPSVPGPSAP